MDTVMPFIAEDGLFRGSYINADKAVSEILACHSYPVVVERALAEVAVLALALSGTIKYKGVFSLQIRAAGPVSTLFVTVTDDKQLRGYAVFEADRLPAVEEADNTTLFGNGQLLFSVSQVGQEPYQGIVALTQKTLCETVLDYFNRSEQIKTELVLRQDGVKTRCLLLQQMPDKAGVSPEEQADLWETLTVLLHSVQDKELFDDNLPPEQVLYRLFHANNLTVFNGAEPVFFCPCHSDKMKRFLTRLSEQEREELYQDGKIVAECQFCQKQYTFERKDF